MLFPENRKFVTYLTPPTELEAYLTAGLPLMLILIFCINITGGWHFPLHLANGKLLVKINQQVIPDYSMQRIMWSCLKRD